MTNKQAYAGLLERLLVMAPEDRSSIVCADRTTREMNRDIREAAEAISSLLKALEEIEREASDEHVAYRCALDGIAKIARAALSGEKP